MEQAQQHEQGQARVVAVLEGAALNKIVDGLLVLGALSENPFQPGFPKWLARVANDGSTKGVPARVRPKPAR